MKLIKCVLLTTLISSSLPLLAEECKDPNLNGVSTSIDFRENSALGFTLKTEHSLQGTDHNSRPHELAEILVGATNWGEFDYSCSAMNLEVYTKANKEYWVLLTAQDDCDGGNTIGTVFSVQDMSSSWGQGELAVSILGQVGDGDVFCDKPGSHEDRGASILAYRLAKALRK